MNDFHPLYPLNSIYLGKKIIELGAGCGLAGLTAAALGANSVVLTDITSQQSHLKKNIELNRYIWEDNCELVDFAVLHFGDENLVYNSNERVRDELQVFDVILGADIGYDLSLHEPIKKTITTLLQQPYPLRGDIPCTPRVVLLAEEIRWGDIYVWYIETLLSDNSEMNAVHDTQILNSTETQRVPSITSSIDDNESLLSGDVQAQGKQRKNPIHLLTLQTQP
jgi:predicted nicotinamide N-methyase